jgi:hypothetical protein
MEIDGALLVVLAVAHGLNSLCTPKEWVYSEDAKGSLAEWDPFVGKFVLCCIWETTKEVIPD